MIAPKDSYALVTGAGSGIGSCYARRLAEQGYNLIIAGNIEVDLLRVKGEIEALASVRVVVVVIDLAHEGASAELFFKAKQIGDVDILINNAGVFCFCDVVKCSEERIARLIMLHNMNVALSCRLFSADMIERGARGYILNMSSYSVWMPFPGLSLYGASKAFVRSFSVAFAKEVREHGITVTAICPAGVATDLYGLPHDMQRMGLSLGVLISADSCARRGLRALRRRRRSVVPDWWNVLFIPFAMFMPRFLINFIRRRTMQFQR